MRTKRQVVALMMFLAIVALACRAADKPLQPYQTAILGKFAVDPELSKSGFPEGYENVLEKTLFARLLSERVFPHVLDDVPGNTAGDISGKVLLLEGEVTDFSKGNRAARVAIGYGAGGAKLRITLVFRDLATHEEVMSLAETGRYIGFGNLTGGSAEKARSESARKVVDKLMKKIKAAR